MTVSITASGIALDGPLVAGEKVAVSVSGIALAAEDKPTLALLARFPDALLASVELAEDAQTPGTWTGELDTATKQTALFFATARADERRDAALELVSGRASLARLTVPMANSALCPKPDGSPFASPVYVPVPGPPGTGGDPYDQAPEMDGEASAGTADEYARGDHRHPTDTSRASAADVAAIQGIIPATASTSNKLATASDLSGKANDADVVKLTGNQTVTGDKTFTGQVSAADIVTGYSFGFQDGKYITAPANSGASLTAGDISESSSALGAALAAKADSSSLASVATTGYYDDLLNKPTIPAAQVNADWNADSGVAQILNKPTIPDVSGKADSASIAAAYNPEKSSAYAVGDYCTYQGALYRCTTATTNPPGAWNAANWTAVAVADEMGGGGSSYYEIEYLESTGTQYIDTGVASSIPTRIQIEVACLDVVANATPVGATNNYTSPNSERMFFAVSSSGDYWSFGASQTYTNPTTQDFAFSLGERMTLDMDVTSSGLTFKRNGATIYTDTTARSLNVSRTLYAFARHNTNSTGDYFVGRIYRLKIWQGDTLVRDFVPIRSGFVGALLDRVSGTFFLNKGTGDFLLGQDVNPPVPTDSPAFTGTPTAPTAAAGTNTTQIATTAFVQSAIAALRSELGLT